ncbi:MULTISPECIES: glucosamine-6-phosphate deaminase [Bacillaceae]|uniref:Glucosamine-6-phosphate deaminase n=1 Tax=Evansella alkalicola TaxID=745819 RepID=A0ABS6JUU8_9BACI|nr:MULTISPECIES: glucosamine-6-phosphate deaminase [Bacillaceae]MBU9722353.1 glucosamine-6-phosphate deaminase [Bacillus alkalicola]
MEIRKVENYSEMSQTASTIIINTIKHKKSPVLGLATGSTPEGLYQELIHQYNNHVFSFKDVTTFNLDEYVGLGKGNPQSYHYYMKEKLFKHLDINMENVNIPNGTVQHLEKECENYEKSIKEAGYIDVQVLGLGLNGHIGFNEPGTPFSSSTHVVELDDTTRKANARFFTSMDEVPQKAITMGLTTIMHSKKILLLVSGENKAEPLARLINGNISEDFPASMLKKHPNVTIIADKSAFVALNSK